MAFFFDPLYLVILIVTLVISGAAQLYIRSTFGKWDKVANSGSLSGLQVGERLVSRANFGGSTGTATGIHFKVVPGDLGRISWSALLTFGGGLTLGIFLTESGASDWLAGRLGGLGGVPSWLGITVVAAVALGLTTVASNTATAAMMIPLAIPLAGILGVDPTLLVRVVAVASSIDFALVIGTPPTMIADSTGLFSSRDIFRVGIILDLVGIGLLVSVVIAIWRVLGLI